MSTTQAIRVTAPSTWRFLLPQKQSASGRVVSGSIIMLVASVLVSGLNFLYNVAMARMLGPARFGHVTAAATILMLFSAVTLSFQLVCAKFVARNKSDYGKQRVYAALTHRSWGVGLVLGSLLALFSPQLTRYLRMPETMLLLILAAGMAVYVPLGVRRGLLQGLCEFPRFSFSLITESALKLVLAVLLVALGYGVSGAIGALSGSVIGAFLLTRAGHGLHPDQAGDYERASFREGIQAIVFFVGQVVINNIDILMVKHYFVAADAGVYAAVALVGRVLYFACWMVVSAMFPVSAATEHEGSAWQVLRWPILIVSVMSAGAVAVMALFPRLIMRLVFGDNFYQSEHLLAIYAALTGIYALVVTLITFEMSRKIANTGWLQLLFSALVIVGISLFHATLMQVAMVQLVLMLVLLAAVSIPFLLKHQRTELEAAA